MSAPATSAPGELSPEQIQVLLTPVPPWKQGALWKSIAIALVSSIVLLAIVAFILSNSTGWESFRQAFLSWPNFKAAWPLVLDGFKLNIKIFMIAEPFILAIGLLIALIRVTRSPVLFPLRAFAVVYTDFFRGAPAILVILMLGFGMPALRLQGVPKDPIFWGTVACILTSSAYTAETFRAGIDSVHPSQRAAARSLGFSNLQTLRMVVLPQAIRRQIPPLLSGFVALQKETALVSVIGPLEATRQAQIYSGLYFNFTSYLTAAVLFIAITVPLARFTDYLVKRDARRRSAGGAY
ncbi:MAG: amino acid ABC transporter permease [Thermomicrobiales bacterium]